MYHCQAMKDSPKCTASAELTAIFRFRQGRFPFRRTHHQPTANDKKALHDNVSALKGRNVKMVEQNHDCKAELHKVNIAIARFHFSNSPASTHASFRLSEFLR